MSLSDQPGDDSLDFHAPEAGVGLTCAACKGPIGDQYWSTGGAAVCTRCKTAVEEGQQAAPDPLSRAARFAKALTYGLGAMLAGAAVWYAVARFAHLEIGIIAILLGYLVGRAVFHGSASRGGLRYQLLAVSLTYLGIGVAYAPLVYEELRGRARTEADSLRGTRPTPDPSASLADKPANELTPGEGEAEAARLDSAIRTAESQAQNPATTPRPNLLVALGFLLLGTLSLPVIVTIGGLPGSLISLLIYSFAIVQAWRLTRSVRVEFAGPFQVGSTPV
ncbi:MAG TPA: hypothetical protein VH879_12675 [Gemmatimonadales bacterium]|jgi:hypothetical protein